MESLFNPSISFNPFSQSLYCVGDDGLDDSFLTPSQQELIQIGISVIDHYNIIVIKGESQSGKNVAATSLFKQLNAQVATFDLCELARMSSKTLTNQQVVKYMDSLVSQLMKSLSSGAGESNSSSKRSRGDIEDDISELSLSPTKIGIIYIPGYNRITDVLSDYTAKLRNFLPVILQSFASKLPCNIKIVMTTTRCFIPESIHWCLELNGTKKDMLHILNRYRNCVDGADIDAICALSKVIPIGRLIYCLKYSLSQKDNFIDNYKVALSRFSGSMIDVEQNVPNPECELVGMNKILDAITTSIITPLSVGISEIPIKKGMLLCGPPGTGKSSVGRWLAHKIKGKFYLVGGEVGIGGSNFIEHIEMTIQKAKQNAPSVVFIDDCDVLFNQPDTYRAFLTLLDGIESNKRSDVCVIVTCMNLRNIPSSLLRGGRLEMVLITKLPSIRKINSILKASLIKMNTILTNAGWTLDPIEPALISSIATKMSGWNCADIHRCVNDVTRMIISNKGKSMSSLFDHCIKQIRIQYELCGSCESTSVSDSTQTYIG